MGWKYIFFRLPHVLIGAYIIIYHKPKAGIDGYRLDFLIWKSILSVIYITIIKVM